MARREFLIDKPLIIPNARKFSAVKPLIASAKRFLIDRSVCDYIASLSDENRMAARRQYMFAKPPYEPMFIQFDTEDSLQIGTLVSSDMWFFAVTSAGRPDCSTIIDATFNPVTRQIDFKGRWPDGDDEMLKAHRSSVDFSEIVFLLMHQPGAINRVDVPHEHGISKGKLRTWRAHSVLTINIGEANPRRIFSTGNRTGACREHEVRGHWLHYPENLRRNGCEHEFQRIEDTARGGERWRCPHCNGLRVWRADFVRGDASLGTKFHTYQVTKGKRKRISCHG